MSALFESFRAWIRRRSLLALSEWGLAVIITAVATALHVARFLTAGPLWRDEVAALNLARMPWNELLHYFPHEAFPLLFPIALRGYISFAGTSDLALRFLGCAIGIIGLGTIWFNASLLRLRTPLIGLTVFALNPLFFFWGDTIRGYGLGTVLIMLTFGLFGSTIIKPRALTFCTAALIAIASVQCLLANTALLLAIGLSATIVHLSKKQIRSALTILGIGCLAAISITPYLESYYKGRDWDVLLREGVSLRWLFIQLSRALGNPTSAMSYAWLILIVGAAIGTGWIAQRRSSGKDKQRPLVLFGFLALLLAPISNCAFLLTLGYPTQEWYYIALIAILILAADMIIGIVSDRLKWVKITRLILVAGIISSSTTTSFVIARVRMSNVDMIAQEIKRSARPTDLVVILPWFLGISFRHYYQTETPWTTLPPIEHLIVHRYDLVKKQMAMTDPLASAMKQMAATLQSGNRLWIVSMEGFAINDQPPRYLAPAPYDPVGWREYVYREAWSKQLGYFLQKHGSHHTVQLDISPRTSPFENAQLTLVEGWSN